jgi:hypothetical protein
LLQCLTSLWCSTNGNIESTAIDKGTEPNESGVDRAAVHYKVRDDELERGNTRSTWRRPRTTRQPCNSIEQRGVQHRRTCDDCIVDLFRVWIDNANTSFVVAEWARRIAVKQANP